ncbi:hypothetical protein [Aeoliella sp.]|uniref:hypothetical protein n=1 Tax=Aeoliella sp. TaxID=2795800 RepID=UPI003CCC1D37
MNARTLVTSALLLASALASHAAEVVVLRNGNVLEGEVDRLQDVVRVATENSQHYLPLRDVERITATLLDAYAAKRIEVREGSVSDHLALAKWCMRQEIWPQAAAEIEDARKIDPKNGAVEYVQRQYEVMSRAAMRTQQAAAPAPPTADDSHQRAAELAEMEKLATSLPPGTLEDFARHVQPILVNGCATGGCHSMDDNRELRLNRDLLRGTANRESTLRNLQAVWNSIDQQTPQYSPLLLQPAVPHGGLPRPVFDGHREKVRERLAEWVMKATGKDQVAPPTQPPTVELAAHQQTVAPPTAQMPPTQPGQPRHFWEDPAAMQSPDTPEATPATKATETPVAKPAIRYGAEPKRYEPRDEFDPEVFNRQHQTPADK